MHQDIKEVVGVLMRVLGGDEISYDDVQDLAYEATGDLQKALNEAFIKLQEFAYDRDARMSDPRLDAKMRAELEQALDKIVRLSAPSPTNTRGRST
jgi:hypothetical protein